MENQTEPNRREAPPAAATAKLHSQKVAEGPGSSTGSHPEAAPRDPSDISAERPAGVGAATCGQSESLQREGKQVEEMKRPAVSSPAEQHRLAL